VAVVRFVMIYVSQPAWIVVVAVLSSVLEGVRFSSCSAAYFRSVGFWLVTAAVKCRNSENHITACFDRPVPHGT